MEQRRKIKGMNSGKRKEQVAQGAYDGRFRQRVIVDKKKQASKNWARKSK